MLSLQSHWDLILWGKKSWELAQGSTEVEYTGEVRSHSGKPKHRTVEDKEERRHGSLKDSQ